MSNLNPSQLTAWTGSIDIANDLVMVWKNSNSTLYKATPNQLANLTSQWVGLSDTQALTNKTLGTTNTITVRDTLFTLQDDGDLTKQAKFQLSGITTGTIRTYTLPNASSTLVDLSTSQTLTNKTLTSPTINAPTITNAAISADAITGFTVSNNGTVYGLSITGGALGTGAVTAGSIAAGAVVPNSLVATSGASWVWAPYTPTVTLSGGGSNGNATISGRFVQTGKTVSFWCMYALGSTTSFAGTTAVTFSLPVIMSATFFAATQGGNIGIGRATDLSNSWTILSSPASTTTVSVICQITSTAYAEQSNIGTTTPFTWGNGHVMQLNGTYEAA